MRFTDGYGKQDENGNWNGVVGEIVNRLRKISIMNLENHV